MESGKTQNGQSVLSKHDTSHAWLVVVLSLIAQRGQDLQKVLLGEEQFLVLLDHLAT